MSDELHFNPVREYERVKTENSKLWERGARLFDKTLELAIENAELREQIQNAEHEESVAWDMVRSAERRNDKLRELAERAWKTAEQLCQAFDGPCSSDGVTVYKPCPMGERYEECVYGQLQRELHEMGVDV